jgi:predicted membrane channel-forming protein YqfA (hemolysin III family)
VNDALRTAWRQSSRLAIITLIVANLLPLVAVLGGQWTLFSVMYLYWAENGIVGGYNVLKLALAQGAGASASSKLVMIPFFILHYGIFWFVHGVFVFVLFGERGLRGFNLAQMALIPPSLWGALGLLLLSHGTSFINNYLGRQEYQCATLEQLMRQPYSRVMILHFVVLAGGFVVMFLGQPLPALVLLVVLKTGFDLRAHLREHGRLKQTSVVIRRD